jgi:hypothetical protein
MRADALDRFGTPLEKRMSAIEIEALMPRCDLIGVRFNTGPPFDFRTRTPSISAAARELLELAAGSCYTLAAYRTLPGDSGRDAKRSRK